MDSKRNNHSGNMSQRYHRREKLIGALLTAVSVILFHGAVISFVVERWTLCVVFFAGLIIWIFVTMLFARKMGTNNMRQVGKTCREKLVEEYSDLYSELLDEFEKHQFEMLTDGTRVYSEAHNGTIELGILYCGHEFAIVIDKEALYMVMDEETDAPLEEEIPLSEMADIGVVFLMIREFVERDF